MTSDQKRVASWIALGFLIAALAALLWLSYLAATSSFVDNPQADDPRLRLSWKVALWFIELGTTLKVVFAALIAVITIGVAAAGELYKSRFQIALISVLSLMGIGACVMLMVFVGDETNGEILRYFSTYDTLPQFEAATNAGMYSLIGWFSAFLTAQLGISIARDGGAVKNLIAHFST